MLTYIHHPAFLLHEMGEGHPERPDRLRAIEFVLAQNLPTLNRRLALPASDTALLRVHTPEHLALIRRTAPEAGYAMIDPDTTMNFSTLCAAILAAGAGILAVDEILAGHQGISKAFCAVRPPGHHSESNRPMGFCFFNNIAVAALHALDHHGLKRVAIIDFDVHHGNGTENIVAGDDRILMLSTFQSPFYPYSGEQPQGQNIVNVALSENSGGQALKNAVLQHWQQSVAEFQPEMIFISAGFDAHRLDPLGGLDWDTEDFAWVTQWIVQQARTHSQGRIVSMLEGGYDLDGLSSGVLVHIRGLISE
jgi:acetoin utilization deacetylase AcuC-like enzyme